MQQSTFSVVFSPIASSILLDLQYSAKYANSRVMLRFPLSAAVGPLPLLQSVTLTCILERNSNEPETIRPVGNRTKQHLLKYRPKMATQLEKDGNLDDWVRSAAVRAVDQCAVFIESGMDAFEAESEAKRNCMFLPVEEDVPQLGENPDALPDPASLVTTPATRPEPLCNQHHSQTYMSLKLETVSSVSQQSNCRGLSVCS